MSSDKAPTTDKGSAQKEPRLTTFRSPTPSPTLINALAPLNRWVMLHGVPGLNKLPVLRRVPGIGGLMQVRDIAFEAVDRDRLKRLFDAKAAVFLTPNHPEFFTDWMLDKYVMASVAPMAASWATHEIVNGLGKTVQTFWLKNNLIAQIPGKGGEAGKAYSVRWAQKGHGVLLHPEGAVGWHGDRIAPLFPGAAEMACQAATQLKDSGDPRATFLAPLVWKLYFVEDASAGLHRQTDYIERRLRLPRSSSKQTPADRVYQIYDSLLARDEIKYAVHPTNAPYGARRSRLIDRLNQRLADHLPKTDGNQFTSHDSSKTLLRHARRFLRESEKGSAKAMTIKPLTKDLTRLLRFDPAWYPQAGFTQEHVAESLKRIRADYCRGSTRDVAHNYLPVPVAARRAVIRAPEPFEVDSEGCEPTGLTEALRGRMQACLDQIIADNAGQQSKFPIYDNPFLRS